MSLKRCNACGRALQATRDYFHSSKDQPDSLSKRCKECQRARVNAAYATLTLEERRVRMLKQKRARAIRMNNDPKYASGIYNWRYNYMKRWNIENKERRREISREYAMCQAKKRKSLL